MSDSIIFTMNFLQSINSSNGSSMLSAITTGMQPKATESKKRLLHGAKPRDKGKRWSLVPLQVVLRWTLVDFHKFSAYGSEKMSTLVAFANNGSSVESDARRLSEILVVESLTICKVLQQVLPNAIAVVWTEPSFDLQFVVPLSVIPIDRSRKWAKMVLFLMSRVCPPRPSLQSFGSTISGGMTTSSCVLKHPMFKSPR